MDEKTVQPVVKKPLDEIKSTIESLENGSLTLKQINWETQQRCVEYLVSEGYSTAEIAILFKTSSRTISRRLRKIREGNAIQIDHYWLRQIIGEAYRDSQQHHAYLIRLSCREDASYTERAQARYLAWKIKKEFTELLLTMGIVKNHGTGIYFTYGSEFEKKQKPKPTKPVLHPEEPKKFTFQEGMS